MSLVRPDLHRQRAHLLRRFAARAFLELIETDPERVARMTHQELMEIGGADGVEIIMWLVMRGALSNGIVCRHRNYYHPMVTGFGQMILEEPNDGLGGRLAAAAE